MKLVLIACCLLLIQSALTAIQVRYYQKSMKALVGKYKGEKGYHLFSGQSRRRIGPGSIVLLVVDESYIIQECQCMRGVSILSTFKEMEEYEGMHLGELLDRLHTSEKNASLLHCKRPYRQLASKHSQRFQRRGERPRFLKKE